MGRVPSSTRTAGEQSRHGLTAPVPALLRMIARLIVAYMLSCCRATLGAKNGPPRRLAAALCSRVLRWSIGAAQVWPPNSRDLTPARRTVALCVGLPK